MGLLNRLQRWIGGENAPSGPPDEPVSHVTPSPVTPADADLDEIRKHFDEAAADEENFPSTIDPRIQHVKVILDHMRSGGPLSGQSVADLGCGKGRFARLLKEAEPQATIICLDLAEAMLAHVPGDLEPVAATMTQLPLATDSCAGAYATESLEHAVDIEAAIAELCRIVRPGGRIAIIDKNAQAWGQLETPPWERWFGQKELEAMLVRHCRDVTSRPISYWDDIAPDGLFLAWLAVK